MANGCPACAQEVAVRHDRHAGEPIIRCANCGLLLAGAVGAAVDVTQVLDELLDPEPTTRLGTVLVADDSELQRTLLKDALLEHRLAKAVRTAKDGREFLQILTEHLHQGLPVDLAILDLQMPILGGGAAGVAMRAVEWGTKVSQRSPILFFTSHPVSDAIRQCIKLCAPAHYLNKASQSSPAELVRRIELIVRGLSL